MLSGTVISLQESTTFTVKKIVLLITVNCTKLIVNNMYSVMPVHLAIQPVLITCINKYLP